MALSIYNSFTQQKEIFEPLVPGHVSLYVCGVTVYDYCHIGHARMFVVFDAITRYLRSQGWSVNYVRNITDIDDKIITRANENGEPFEALTKRFIEAFHADTAALNNIPPTSEPCATEFIPQMIAMIETLVDKGYAYIANNGDVYYDVTKFEHYGCLAHRDLDSLQAGARVDLIDEKRGPLDFVLWKMAKPGEPSWSSPWGEGRPGWHIECSAMSTQLLGSRFDIHGGGFDLIFPHHENEIAQAQAATGESFANYWMHVGFLQVDKEKMSKSLGNFFTVQEVLAKYDPEIVRYFLLTSHYRSQLNYSIENLNNARAALERFYGALRGLGAENPFTPSHYTEKFNAAMNDDFNTPVALSVLFDMTHEINTLKNSDLQQAAVVAAELKALSSTLGILTYEPDAFLQSGVTPELQAKIEKLIADRIAARQEKNYQRADEIRAELKALGVEIEDAAGKTIWRVSGDPSTALR